MINLFYIIVCIAACYWAASLASTIKSKPLRMVGYVCAYGLLFTAVVTSLTMWNAIAILVSFLTLIFVKKYVIKKLNEFYVEHYKDGME